MNDHAAAGGPAAPMRAALRIPFLQPADLLDPVVLVQVHRAAARTGHVSAGEAGEVEVFALAELARRKGRQNPAGLLYRLLEQPAAVRSPSQSDEQSAQARRRNGHRCLYLDPIRPKPDPSPSPASRGHPDGSAVVTAALEAVLPAFRCP